MERMADRIVLVWNEPDANGEPVSGFALARRLRLFASFRRRAPVACLFARCSPHASFQCDGTRSAIGPGALFGCRYQLEMDDGIGGDWRIAATLSAERMCALWPLRPELRYALRAVPTPRAPNGLGRGLPFFGTSVLT